MTREQLERTQLRLPGRHRWSVPFGLASTPARNRRPHRGVLQYVSTGHAPGSRHRSQVPEFPRGQANLAALERHPAAGRPFDIATLDPGADATVSYANHYLANGAVIVPVGGDAADERALETLRALHPHREVVGVPGGTIAVGGGGPTASHNRSRWASCFRGRPSSAITASGRTTSGDDATNGTARCRCRRMRAMEPAGCASRGCEKRAGVSPALIYHHWRSLHPLAVGTRTHRRASERIYRTHRREQQGEPAGRPHRRIQDEVSVRTNSAAWGELRVCDLRPGAIDDATQRWVADIADLIRQPARTAPSQSRSTQRKWGCACLRSSRHQRTRWLTGISPPNRSRHT
jgi:hypothetical protein